MEAEAAERGEMSTVELKLKEQIQNVGVEKIEETEKPKAIPEKAEMPSIADDEEDYTARQLRRIP